MATVLVVDDQDLVRDVVRLALVEAGFRVLTVGAPSEAIELVKSEHDIDLVLLDVVMPEMDAFELAGLLGDQLPAAKVLYMSGYTDAREEGHFIQKPFSPAELADKVRAVLAGP